MKHRRERGSLAPVGTLVLRLALVASVACAFFSTAALAQTPTPPAIVHDDPVVINEASVTRANELFRAGVTFGPLARSFECTGCTFEGRVVLAGATAFSGMEFRECVFRAGSGVEVVDSNLTVARGPEIIKIFKSTLEGGSSVTLARSRFDLPHDAWRETMLMFSEVHFGASTPAAQGTIAISVEEVSFDEVPGRSGTGSCAYGCTKLIEFMPTNRVRSGVALDFSVHRCDGWFRSVDSSLLHLKNFASVDGTVTVSLLNNTVRGRLYLASLGTSPGAGAPGLTRVVARGNEMHARFDVFVSATTRLEMVNNYMPTQAQGLTNSVSRAYVTIERATVDTFAGNALRHVILANTSMSGTVLSNGANALTTVELRNIHRGLAGILSGLTPPLTDLTLQSCGQVEPLPQASEAGNTGEKLLPFPLFALDRLNVHSTTLRGGVINLTTAGALIIEHARLEGVRILLDNNTNANTSYVDAKSSEFVLGTSIDLMRSSVANAVQHSSASFVTLSALTTDSSFAVRLLDLVVDIYRLHTIVKLFDISLASGAHLTVRNCTVFDSVSRYCSGNCGKCFELFKCVVNEGARVHIDRVMAVDVPSTALLLSVENSRFLASSDAAPNHVVVEGCNLARQRAMLMNMRASSGARVLLRDAVLDNGKSTIGTPGALARTVVRNVTQSFDAASWDGRTHTEVLGGVIDVSDLLLQSLVIRDPSNAVRFAGRGIRAHQLLLQAPTDPFNASLYSNETLATTVMTGDELAALGYANWIPSFATVLVLSDTTFVNPEVGSDVTSAVMLDPQMRLNLTELRIDTAVVAGCLVVPQGTSQLRTRFTFTDVSFLANASFILDGATGRSDVDMLRLVELSNCQLESDVVVAVRNVSDIWMAARGRLLSLVATQLNPNATAVVDTVVVKSRRPFNLLYVEAVTVDTGSIIRAANNHQTRPDGVSNCGGACGAVIVLRRITMLAHSLLDIDSNFVDMKRSTSPLVDSSAGSRFDNTSLVLVRNNILVPPVHFASWSQDGRTTRNAVVLFQNNTHLFAPGHQSFYTSWITLHSGGGSLSFVGNNASFGPRFNARDGSMADQISFVRNTFSSTDKRYLPHIQGGVLERTLVDVCNAGWNASQQDDLELSNSSLVQPQQCSAVDAIVIGAQPVAGTDAAVYMDACFDHEGKPMGGTVQVSGRTVRCPPATARFLRMARGVTATVDARQAQCPVVTAPIVRPQRVQSRTQTHSDMRVASKTVTNPKGRRVRTETAIPEQPPPELSTTRPTPRGLATASITPRVDNRMSPSVTATRADAVPTPGINPSCTAETRSLSQEEHDDEEQRAALADEHGDSASDTVEAVAPATTTAALLGGVASPSAAARVPAFAYSVRLTECAIDADDAPPLYEHPLQFELGGGRKAAFAGATVASTLVVLGGALLMGGCVALARRSESGAGTDGEVDAAGPRSDGEPATAVVKAHQPSHFAGVAAAVLLAYLAPAVAGTASGVVHHGEPAQRAAALVCGAAVLGLLGALLRVAAGPAFMRRIRVVPDDDDDASGGGAKPDTGGSSDEVSRLSACAFAPTPGGVWLTSALSVFVDAARDVRHAPSRLWFFEDVAFGVVQGAVGGWDSESRGECLGMAAVIGAAALAHIAYVLYCRPYRSRADSVFSAANGVCAGAIAFAALAEASSGVVDGIVILQTVFFVLQPVAALVHEARRWRRSGKQKGRRDAADTEAAPGAAGVPLLAVPPRDTGGPAAANPQAAAATAGGMPSSGSRDGQPVAAKDGLPDGAPDGAGAQRRHNPLSQ